MVAGAAAGDAVERALRMPGLQVGLHVVVVEGRATLPTEQVPSLVDAGGSFPTDQAALGVRYFFLPGTRRELRAEIRAQFSAFAATGLTLDHANAHKHMHLHPTVGRLLIEEGRRFGLPALRIPAEPPGILAACGHPPGLGAHALYAWSKILRHQARRAGLRVNSAAFGIAWSGHMTVSRVLGLVPHLPPGLNEIYFHPATHADATIRALMPDYDHAGELQALLDPAVAAALGPLLGHW